MPKERINSPQYYSVDFTGDESPALPPLADNAIRNPTLWVHWGRPNGDVADGPAGHVQIEMDLDPADMEHRLDSGEDATGIGFFTDSLSRAEINRLIRVLRKARDQAHGADE